MPDIGFLNGRFLPLEETRVSVEDRGFLFGDGVYEVIRTYGGRPFRVEAHLARLERSVSAIQLRSPYGIQEWRGLIDEGIRRSGYPEAKIYIQVTRGAAPRDHAFPEGVSPTAVMTVRTMPPLAPSLHTDGVPVVTLEDPRWARCDIKSVNLLANVLARQRAREAGAFEVLFVRGGEVAEGAVSNVMVVQRGALLTPPEGPRILSGVTRAVVLELARKEGLPVQERAVTVEALRGGDEVLLVGTTIEILSVIRIDDQPVGDGRPGPLARRLLDLWHRDLETP